jgi:hypothetical protein
MKTPLKRSRPNTPRAAATAIAALLGVVLFAGEAATAAKECRHIQSRKERNICYEQQAKAKAKNPPAPRSAMDTQLEQMRSENERVQQRMKGICRGC